jgi:hypothetical protein
MPKGTILDVRIVRVFTRMSLEWRMFPSANRSPISRSSRERAFAGTCTGTAPHGVGGSDQATKSKPTAPRQRQARRGRARTRERAVTALASMTYGSCFDDLGHLPSRLSGGGTRVPAAG